MGTHEHHSRGALAGLTRFRQAHYSTHPRRPTLTVGRDPAREPKGSGPLSRVQRFGKSLRGGRLAPALGYVVPRQGRTSPTTTVVPPEPRCPATPVPTNASRCATRYRTSVGWGHAQLIEFRRRDSAYYHGIELRALARSRVAPGQLSELSPETANSPTAADSGSVLRSARLRSARPGRDDLRVGSVDESVEHCPQALLEGRQRSRPGPCRPRAARANRCGERGAERSQRAPIGLREKGCSTLRSDTRTRSARPRSAHGSDPGAIRRPPAGRRPHRRRSQGARADRTGRPWRCPPSGARRPRDRRLQRSGR